MRIEDFDFYLPTGQIANQPAERRDGSRLIHVRRSTGTIGDTTFGQISELLNDNDVLVLNNTKVFPARIIGLTDTGASIEFLLEEELRENRWQALAKPARRLKPGKTVDFGEGLNAQIIERSDAGRIVLDFQPDTDVWAALDRLGQTPLPHYIKRENETAADSERYQTVYAANRGAIAAPTAGLHFTDKILDGLRLRGIEVLEVTLHVGYGTFEPVRVDDLGQHRVLAERIEISEDAAAALNHARRANNRIVAVGTTTTRALESSIDDSGNFCPQNVRTSLTVTPGYRFRAVDALLTNFHLPKSSLLILVSTFGGHELIMKAYEHAVKSGYRFYSYGDCMFIE